MKEKRSVRDYVRTQTTGVANLGCPCSDYSEFRNRKTIRGGARCWLFSVAAVEHYPPRRRFFSLRFLGCTSPDISAADSFGDGGLVATVVVNRMCVYICVLGLRALPECRRSRPHSSGCVQETRTFRRDVRERTPIQSRVRISQTVDVD